MKTIRLSLIVFFAAMIGALDSSAQNTPSLYVVTEQAQQQNATGVLTVNALCASYCVKWPGAGGPTLGKRDNATGGGFGSQSGTFTIMISAPIIADSGESEGWRCQAVVGAEGHLTCQAICARHTEADTPCAPAPGP